MVETLKELEKYNWNFIWIEELHPMSNGPAGPSKIEYNTCRGAEEVSDWEKT